MASDALLAEYKRANEALVVINRDLGARIKDLESNVLRLYEKLRQYEKGESGALGGAEPETEAGEAREDSAGGGSSAPETESGEGDEGREDRAGEDREEPGDEPVTETNWPEESWDEER